MKRVKPRYWMLCVGILFVLTGGLATPSETLAQTGINLIYDNFDPMVIPIDRTEPVRYEVKITGRPSRVVLQFDNGGELDLRDDGSNDDRLAGDNLYSGLVPASEITGRLQPDDVFRVFVGFVAAFQGQDQLFRGNVFSEVITDEVPRFSLTQLANDVQMTDYLVNIVDPGLARSLESNGLDIPSQRFYQLFGDDYDFLNVISATGFFSNRFHFAVKNTVSGIGEDFFNSSGNYGSRGRLMGISMFPKSIFFDGVEDGYQHELAHQWVMFVDTFPFGQGVPHWPLSSMASGIMGWSNPFNGQGQQFPCEVQLEDNQVRLMSKDQSLPKSFNDMDLYLMGLLPASAVKNQVVFVDQNFDSIIQQCNGSIYNGDVIHVSAQDIINAYGPRVPAFENAQKQFRIATIIVSPDQLLDASTMSFFSHFAQRAELKEPARFRSGFLKGDSNPFFVATRGLGELITCIGNNCDNLPIVTVADRDGDGVPDDEDLCPDFSGTLANDGC